MVTRTGGYQIEFVGGPLDGRIDGGSLPLEPFMGVVTAAGGHQMSGLLRAICGAVGWCRPQRVRLAVYELELGTNRLQYRYLWTQAVTAQQVERMASFLPIDAST